MPYGPQKYPAPELARNITEVIGDHLARFSAFNNTSLCYFGARIKYRIEIDLFSRGETKEIVSKETQIGDLPTLEEQTDPALAIVGETAHIEGEKTAGRVPKPVDAVEAQKTGEVQRAPNGRGDSKGQPAGDVKRNQHTPEALGRGARKTGGDRVAV